MEKYALENLETHEVIGLGAYRDAFEDNMIYVEYIESAPASNPTITNNRKYKGVGRVLLAYGIQISIDYGYGGAIYLMAKTSRIREHYIQKYGAFPYSHLNPHLLIVEGEAAKSVFFRFLKEG